MPRTRVSTPICCTSSGDCSRKITRQQAPQPLHAPASGGDAFGNAIASRWPILRQTAESLPGVETGEHRSVLGVLVDTPAGVLPFVTTHLAWRFDHGAVRERQVVAVADFVRRLAHDA